VRSVEGALTETFRPERPVHLGETLFPVRVGPRDPTMRFLPNRDVWRATRTPHGPATERLRQVDGVIRVDAWGPGAGWLVERAPALCGGNDDPSAFQPEQLVLRRLVLAHPGLRLGRSDAVFEATMAAILEQRVSTRKAWRNWQALVRVLGEPAPGPVPQLRLSPAPTRVGHASLHLLQVCGIDRQRALALKRAAIVAHRLEEATRLPHETAQRRLQSVPGIGPWTSARVTGAALGDPDAVMVGDLHLPHLVTWALAGEPRGTDERMLELLEPHRGQRARVIRLLMLGAMPRTAVNAR
jgi:3-methyladenine DNA glycosylase/8-oxoguanine DNA glycosylase